MLSKWSDKHERLFLEFMRYKTRVPVCGAVMINQTWDKVSFQNEEEEMVDG